MLKSPLRHSAWLALSLTAVVATPALADGFVIQKGTTDKGCIVYAPAQYEGSGAVVPFSGACTPGQPVDGKGTMTGGDKAFVGTWVKGFMHGNFTIGGVPAVMDMGCPVSIGGKPYNPPGCKEAVTKFLGAKPVTAAPVAAKPVAVAPTAPAVTPPTVAASPAAQPTPTAKAAPVVAAAPAAMPGADHYRKVCAAELTPANAEKRAQEMRDMNGGSIEEARAMSAKETSDLFTKVTMLTDAQLNEALSQANGMKQLIEMSDSDPFLQQKAGPRLLRCVFKARIAAGKAAKGAVTATAPVATTAAVPTPATPTAAAATGLKPGQFSREVMNRCLKYSLVSLTTPGTGFSTFTFRYTNACDVDLTFVAPIMQDGVNVNLLKASGIIKARETREFKETVSEKKNKSLYLAWACETKEAAERAVGRKVSSIGYSKEARACIGNYWAESTGGTAH